jgi:hypothetical protein
MATMGSKIFDCGCLLIWLSTWGASARMAADLRRRATG